MVYIKLNPLEWGYGFISIKTYMFPCTSVKWLVLKKNPELNVHQLAIAGPSKSGLGGTSWTFGHV